MHRLLICGSQQQQLEHWDPTHIRSEACSDPDRVSTFNQLRALSPNPWVHARYQSGTTGTHRLLAPGSLSFSPSLTKIWAQVCCDLIRHIHRRRLGGNPEDLKPQGDDGKSSRHRRRAKVNLSSNNRPATPAQPRWTHLPFVSSCFDKAKYDQPFPFQTAEGP